MSAPDLTTLTPTNIVPFIADIFARRGAEEYIGEPVTISEHMLQAAEFAEKSGADEDVIAAALLHDIGHWPFCHPIEDMRLEGMVEHESRASQWLSSHDVRQWRV